jgi:hypothetical protein
MKFALVLKPRAALLSAKREDSIAIDREGSRWLLGYSLAASTLSKN